MNTKLIGALGEQMAGRFLRDNGYRILSANYKTNAGEIDIVAKKDDILSIVEVKTRKEGGMLPPQTAVDYNKQENIKATAAAYVGRCKINLPVRYDIIEVLLDENNKCTSVNHIIDAF